MSETRASIIIEAFHDNHLASSVLKALIENDEKLFLDALYAVNLRVEDLTLSDIEFDNLVQGVKPSGELDILTWEGYYEVNSGSNLDDPLAFLILSTTRSVYWGSRSQIMSQPGDYAVDYTLTSDGTINFSTPSHGDISMTFTRTFDDDTGDLNTKFSAVCNGQIVSGEKITPPLQVGTSDLVLSNPWAGRTLTIRTPLSLLIININPSASAHDKGNTKSPRSSSPTWQDICTIVSTGIGVVSFLGFFYQLFRWVKESNARRAERSQRIRRQLEEGKSVERIELLTEHRAKSLDVNFDSAGRKITDAITSEINGKINLGMVDLKQDPERLVRDLRETARTTGEEALYSYVKSRIGFHIYEMLDPYKTLPSYEAFKEQALIKSIREHVDPKIRDLGTEAYDLLIRSVLLPARKRVFFDNYKTLEEIYKGKESAYSEAQRTRENTEREIKVIEKKLQEAKDDAERRELDEQRERLRTDLEEHKAYERELLQAKERARKDKDKAAQESREADRHVREDTSKADWDRKVDHVFKK